MKYIRSHWLYRTLEVVGVLLVGTLVCVGMLLVGTVCVSIVGAFANLFLWFAK
jgi:hypothetical protein